VILGCIGDDFTGSSDLANTLAKEGMRVTQYVGVPDGAAAPEVEAGVVALKSRSNDPREAVAQSLAALDWLRAQGCTQVFFKYCSTFDSTAEGNIGPVAQALADALDARGVVFCPAFPGTGRSIYQGHLFVADALLSESGMQNHPLTPMTDPDLRRVLAAQSSESVGHVGYADVAQGASAISAALAREDAAGHRFVIMDALQDSDLREIGAALDGAALITGGSGVALGLPANFRKAGLIGEAGSAWQGQTGPCVILSGSCSIATRGQLEVHRADSPSMEISAEQILSGDVTAQSATAWAVSQEGIPVIYSSADPEVVRQVQKTHGREASAEAIEAFFAATARALVAAGVTRLITAGGETSGAVVEGLSLGELAIGPEIDPGVPALRAGEDLVLALKSGNFGAPDFFAKAAGILEGRG
jgi:uncharacterized protein YgbK (DUF1537 family)